MSATEEKLARLIRDFYDAALDEGRWQTALHAFGGYFGGVGIVMHSLGRDRSLLYVSEGLQEATIAYQNDWWRHDPLVAVARERGYRSGLFIDRNVLPEEVMRRGPFYQDFLASHGIQTISGLLASPFPDTTLSIALQSPPGTDLDRDRFTLFSLIGDHVSRAAAVGSALGDITADRDTLLAGYERFACAVALVKPDGTVIAANERMRAMNGQGLAIRRGRVVADVHARQRDLDRFIGATAGGIRAVAPPVIAIARESGALPLLLRAIPVSPEQIERQFGAVERVGAVMLMVIDPDLEAEDEAETVLRAMGLTRAQARIAAMVGAGRAPAEIAEALGVSQNTIRTTIKAIYARLGISRQADLARIVAIVRPLG